MVIHKSTYSWYLSRGDSGYTDHPPGLFRSIGIVRVIGLFVALATVLQVKDTGKGKKG